MKVNMEVYSYNNTTITNMKLSTIIMIAALPMIAASCKPKETTTPAADAAEAAAQATKDAAAKAVEKTAAAATTAADATAAAATDAAADAAKAVEEAAAAAAKAAAEAAAPAEPAPPAEGGQ